MNEQEFLAELGDILQTDEAISADFLLEGQPAWDSLAWMMVLALAERENMKPVKMAQLRAPGTARDLYLLLTAD